jgi:hypothetical protein
MMPQDDVEARVHDMMSEALEYAQGADPDAARRLYDTWFGELTRQTDGLDGADADRVIFSALAQMAAIWLATQHCDRCREQWASRLALLAGESSKLLAAQVEGEQGDVTKH